jgi:hypothetical protein
MAFKANGRNPAEGPIPSHRASLGALQELIGAIDTGETSVTRLVLGECELFLFAVRRTPRFGEPPNTASRRVARPSSPGPSSTSKTAPALDSIIDAACRRLHVTRADIVSASRSKPLSLARALIARHAADSGAASISQVASIMKLHQNSLYVSIGRYRKIIPKLFTMSLEKFLDTSQGPSEKLQSLMGEKWTSSNAGRTPSDAEMAGRISSALPSPGT